MIDFGDDKTFIENYQKLKSSRKMGELYGCDKKTITSHAKKIGYNVNDNKIIKITKIPIEEVITKYEELGSCKKVGEYYNCSATAINNYLKANNYKIQNKNAKLSNISIEEFIQIYDNLKSAELVAKYYQCSATAILNFAKKINYNPKLNKNYKLSEKDKEEIINQYYTKSSTELAQKYSVSRGMITKIWYDNNLIGKTIKNSKTTEKDITGQQFGLWTVLYKTDKHNSTGIIYWHCKCKCGIERDVLGSSLRNGLSLSCGCHNNISKGNEKIKLLLLEANIPFEIEKKFKSCKDKKELPFDFYVDNKYLIEYDGPQHFNKESIFDYEYTHKHDLLKNEWCIQNNISLIRIPYTHFNNLSIEDLKLETSNFIINKSI